MTSPSLGDKLFGDGNIGGAFEMFPDEHICSKYCHWFHLTNPKEIFIDEGEDDEGSKGSNY